MKRAKQRRRRVLFEVDLLRKGSWLRVHWGYFPRVSNRSSADELLHAAGLTPIT